MAAILKNRYDVITIHTSEENKLLRKVDKWTSYWCQIFSGFHTPKIIKLV